MTPREFLRLVVRPNVAEAEADVSDVRLTYNAVMAVDALAAHVFHWCKKHDPERVRGLVDDTWFRAECGKNRANVQMLHDLAKASKHVELERGKPTIKTFADVQPRGFGYGEGVYGGGPYGGGDQVSVMVDGAKIQVGWLMRQTIDFYVAEMDAAGVPET
ncbi:hypothetical protein [Antarcticirhabdus aurantiaca]|uniref:Uncharacterized protein n=1 Tax=Antarcticirhabdus aurantiaca TaxID=2606717 RepID=A0ACD4NV66_9HYPH|nr:hypothetical protein [Antarcticirhabdus aurantiaca]WAJ30626.1 hypothetical protein OXU80_10640 [Jeongeuplla avenae]